MPNVTSYYGSWMVWFAESKSAGPTGGTLRAPAPIRKVDPKYIAAAVSERVEGVVRLFGVIRGDGRVESIAIIKRLDDRLDKSAAEALEMGLVNKVVPFSDLRTEVESWCQELLAKSPTALKLAKVSFNADSDNIHGIGALGFTALASVLPEGTAGPLNAGPHGFAEILYAYSSQTANNGSAFAGLTGNTPFYNVTGAIAMLIGRYGMIIPILAIAGSMAAKRTVAPSLGTFPTTGPLWTVLLIGVVVVVGALTFFPALSLGPIVEQLLQNAGATL